MHSVKSSALSAATLFALTLMGTTTVATTLATMSAEDLVSSSAVIVVGDVRSNATGDMFADQGSLGRRIHLPRPAGGPLGGT
jgi:hypothetical protein